MFTEVPFEHRNNGRRRPALIMYEHVLWIIYEHSCCNQTADSSSFTDDFSVLFRHAPELEKKQISCTVFIFIRTLFDVNIIFGSKKIYRGKQTSSDVGETNFNPILFKNFLSSKNNLVFISYPACIIMWITKKHNQRAYLVNGTDKMC